MLEPQKYTADNSSFEGQFEIQFTTVFQKFKFFKIVIKISKQKFVTYILAQNEIETSEFATRLIILIMCNGDTVSFINVRVCRFFGDV